MDFLVMLNDAGFEKVECLGETGFNSSPKTKGMLIRARKPLKQKMVTTPSVNRDGIDNLSIFLPKKEKGAASSFTSIDDIVARAIEMGAKKAKVIDTNSIVVDKWVKWKCLYGCPMVGKDGYHPPMTPDIDEVKEVFSEYGQAVLLNGEDGRLLTEIACRLEGEAYHSGFYKSFALTALSAGTGPAEDSEAST